MVSILSNMILLVASLGASAIEEQKPIDLRLIGLQTLLFTFEQSAALLLPRLTIVCGRMRERLDELTIPAHVNEPINDSLFEVQAGTVSTGQRSRCRSPSESTFRICA